MPIAAADPPNPSLFLGERQTIRLTVAGRARLWRSARDRRPEPHKGRHICLGCPIGGANAGEQHEPLVEAHEGMAVCLLPLPLPLPLPTSARSARRRVALPPFKPDKRLGLVTAR